MPDTQYPVTTAQAAPAGRRPQRGTRTAGAAWAAEPVFDPSISAEDRDVLLGLRELLWTAGEPGPVRLTMQAKGADDHLKAIGLLSVPTIGLSVIGLLLKSGADRTAGFYSFLYRLAEICTFIVAGVLVLCALGLYIGMMRNQRAYMPEDYAMDLASELQGRYVLPNIDLDDQSRELYLRARTACARITESRAYVQGLLDTNAHRAVLPRLVWELASELAELTNKSALLGDSFQAGPKPGAGQSNRARELAEAMAVAERRVVALEAHADRVAALDPLCQELTAARDLAAEHPTVEMAGLRTLGRFADQEKSWLSDALSASRARVDSEARSLTDDARRLRDQVFTGEPARGAFTTEGSPSVMMGQ
ncbi:MAG TPA: hypothetical protein VGX23_34305 [Actinocrinis sp.]|nr:hypothetical protein [Actinocrinis sp.]